MTAIIMTMEPVFAAVFGYWLAGTDWWRCRTSGVLILGALVIGEVVPRLGRRGEAPQA